ncbi:transposase family protein [Streptomyces murinus]|uniref:transposase family protein n=1 Tax=Streptomyces murinus TaxID=33900 RepID=UPI003F44E6E8
MCRQSATVCLVKSPAMAGCSELSLVERLVRLPDPRRRRGRRHPFVAVLLVSACAVVAGALSYTAIAQWARNAPQETLARCGARLLTSLNVPFPAADVTWSPSPWGRSARTSRRPPARAVSPGDSCPAGSAAAAIPTASCTPSVSASAAGGRSRSMTSTATATSAGPADWAIKASGKASEIEPYLRRVTCQQLFFANLQRPKNGGPRVGEAGRRVLKPPPVPEPHHVITTTTQLTLFTATRNFRRFDRELHANLANPWLVRARQAARALGEARGWGRWITSDVNRALVIVLSGFRDGESIRYSELFPALRVRELPVVRTAEVLDRLGLFAADRAPPSTGGWNGNSTGCPGHSSRRRSLGFALSSTVAPGLSLAPGIRDGPTWGKSSRCCWSGPAATTISERSRAGRRR